MKDLVSKTALFVFEVKICKEILLEAVNKFNCKVSPWRLKYHALHSVHLTFAGELSA